MGERHPQRQGFLQNAGCGLRDPQGKPKREGDEITEPTEKLPPAGLGKKRPDQDLDKKPRHRGN